MTADQLEPLLRRTPIVSFHPMTSFLVIAMGVLVACGDLTTGKSTNVQFFEAAQRGDAAAALQLLAAGANIDQRDAQGAVALHWAARFGHVNVVRTLLEAEANIDQRDAQGETPLHWAARQGQPGTALLLLEAGIRGVRAGQTKSVEPSERSNYAKRALRLHGVGTEDAFDVDEWTPLHEAARTGNAAEARALLRAGAQLAAEDKQGMTPLHRAAAFDRGDVVRLLVDAGADPDAQTAFGWSSIELSIATGHATMVRSLLEIGAQRNPAALYQAAYFGHADVTEVLLEFGADPKAMNSAHPYRFTPLHYAAAAGHIDAAETLVAAGVSADIRDGRGVTPLWVASNEGTAEMARLFLDAGAYLDAIPTGDGFLELIPDEDQHSRPMHRAARKGHWDFVMVLLEAGADPEAQDLAHTYRYTALHYAAAQGNIGVAEALLAAGVSVDLPDGGGATPLWVASGYGSAEMVQFLVNAGAAVEVTPENDPSIVSNAESRKGGPLHQAAAACSSDTVEILLAAGANPVEWWLGRDYTKFTPSTVATCTGVRQVLEDAVDNLSDAVEFGFECAAERLLEAGADPDVLTVATRSHECIGALVERLLEAGADPNATELGRWNHLRPGQSSRLTALHFAAESPFACDRLDSARLLLQAGADPNASDEHGWTPLHAAVASICQSEENNSFSVSFFTLSEEPAFDMIKLLLEFGADPNAVYMDPGLFGGPLTSTEMASSCSPFSERIPEVGPERLRKTLSELLSSIERVE